MLESFSIVIFCHKQNVTPSLGYEKIISKDTNRSGLEPFLGNKIVSQIPHRGDSATVLGIQLDAIRRGN
jgi:5'(3')-deoxyribonucleotidase